MNEPMHLGVGQWHGPLCLLGEKLKTPDLTLLRERVTCPECLMLWDALEERGWPVKRRRQWWQGRTEKASGEWVELLWQVNGTPSPERQKTARTRGYRLERVLVIDPRSLAHHAVWLKGAR